MYRGEALLLFIILNIYRVSSVFIISTNRHYVYNGASFYGNTIIIVYRKLILVITLVKALYDNRILF